MKKISSGEIITEAFQTLFNNFGYIFKKLWFVITVYFIASFMLFIAGAYDGLLMEWIDQNYFPNEDLWSGLIPIGFIIANIILIVITSLNIIGYLAEFGVTKNINRMGLWGIRFGKTELKIAAVIVMILAIAVFFAIIPWLISGIFFKINLNLIGILLMLFAVICFIGISQRFSLAIPIAVMEKDNIGLGDSWDKTKGRWKTIIALTIFLYIGIQVGKVAETLLEAPSSEIDFSNNFWIYGLMLKALLYSIYLYLSSAIFILIPVAFYKKIKGIK